jgi:hypothetical protein
MNVNKAYLEYGTHRGSTLVSAAINNADRTCYGIDIFLGTYGDTVKEECAANIAGFENVTLIVGDGDNFLRNAGSGSPLYNNVEIYFFDGEHTYQATVDGILCAKNILADEAIVLVDDVIIRPLHKKPEHRDRDMPYLACKYILEAYPEEFQFVRFFEDAGLFCMCYRKKV